MGQQLQLLQNYVFEIEFHIIYTITHVRMNEQTQFYTQPNKK